MSRFLWIVLIATGCALGGPQVVKAQNVFEKLIMPGELIEGHAKLEKKCANCHKSFSQKEQTNLCRTCHVKVDADLKKKRGFHGRRKQVAGAECRHCHTDHIGRDADIIQFDPETFNHAFTDFELKGAHKTVSCDGCHREETVKHRDAPGRCIDCHKTDEPHKGRLGDACDSCHNENTWQKTTPFDHAKTKFPLSGAHKDVQCKTCHAGEHYKGVSTACVDCHRSRDVHKGRFGAKCASCHTTKKWETVTFNHDTDTKFKLRGGHRKTGCYDCHTGGNAYTEKLSAKCSACHANDDPHKGKLGKSCGTCHNETGWRDKVAFDHDITKFPLIGLHATAPCEECHLTPSFKDASTACIDCHKIDDYHKGRLKNDCALCHNPNSWQLWRFDHAVQAKYPLTGAHDGLDCHACHKKGGDTYVSVPTACYDCHRNDDVHRRSYGRFCEKCHTTESFSEPFNN